MDLSFQTGLARATSAVERARSQLGQRLFNDGRLSITGQYSCASCHLPELAFTDGIERSRGALGDALPHNAPTLFNAALKHQYNWRTGGPVRLHQQHEIPLTHTTPVELGFNVRLLQPLNRDLQLLRMLELANLPEAQGKQEVVFTEPLITALLAHYVSTLSCATAFDRFLFSGDEQALSTSARAGLQLFTSAELDCSGCHRGPLLGGGLRTRTHSFAAITVQRRRGDAVIELHTPSLRQVSRTAPYLFDGSLPSLDAVISQYESGEGTELPPVALSPQERRDLLAFLRTL